MFINKFLFSKSIIFFSSDSIGNSIEEKDTGETPVTKGEADTFVCDGASLTCPNMTEYTDAGGMIQSGVATGGLKLIVTDVIGKFMGVDPMGTENELKPENTKNY